MVLSLKTILYILLEMVQQQQMLKLESEMSLKLQRVIGEYQDKLDGKKEKELILLIQLVFLCKLILKIKKIYRFISKKLMFLIKI